MSEDVYCRIIKINEKQYEMRSNMKCPAYEMNNTGFILDYFARDIHDVLNVNKIKLQSIICSILFLI